MKSLLLSMACALVMLSCTQSPEKKAEVLIADAMKKTLILADTYESVETKLDSAFAPYDSPEFYKKAIEFFNLVEQVNKLDDEMKSAQSSMAIWGGPYQTTFGRHEYVEHKEKYDNASSKKEKAVQKTQNLVEQIKSMASSKPQFIGFKAVHRYRAKNNAGTVLMDDRLFMFNEDFTEIVYSVGLDDDEYQAAQALIKELENNGEY